MKENNIKPKTTEQLNKHILFVDMDGTLAKWEEYYVSLDEMTVPGFFRNLPPIQNVVNAVKIMVEQYTDVDVYILSAVISDEGIVEKTGWMEEHLPEIPKERRVFVKAGTNKGDIIKQFGVENPVLLDDYTKNLREWREAGGRGICLLNGDNHVSGKWTGDYVTYKTDSETLAETLRALVLK